MYLSGPGLDVVFFVFLFDFGVLSKVDAAALNSNVAGSGDNVVKTFLVYSPMTFKANKLVRLSF